MPRAVGKPSQHPDVVIPLGSVEPPAPRPRSPASAALSSVAHGDPSSIPACRPSNRKTSRSTRSTRPSPSAASPRCSYRRDRRRATGELVEIDAVQRAVEGQVDPVVLRPVAGQAVAEAGGVIRSTVLCSSTPARTVFSMSVRLRRSSTTESIRRRWSRWESMRPTGPAPTMPTWVRVISSVIVDSIIRSWRAGGARGR